MHDETTRFREELIFKKDDEVNDGVGSSGFPRVFPTFSDSVDTLYFGEVAPEPNEAKALITWGRGL
jgi:hypothetical protein